MSSIVKRPADLLPQPDSDFDGVAVMLIPQDEDAHSVSKHSRIPMKHLHTTLVYYGDAAPLYERGINIMRMVEALRWVARQEGPVEATLGGVTRFSAPGNDPVVLAVDSKGVHKVREAVLRALEGIGVQEASEHGFTPHMTLGYIRHGQKLDLPRWKPMDIIFDRIRIGFGGDQIDLRLDEFDSKAVVRTREGSIKFGQPVGATIVRDEDEELGNVHQKRVPAPTTVRGYWKMFDRVPTELWGGGDVSISHKMPDGRRVWLYGDTLSEKNGFMHSTALVQKGGRLHVSNGGKQLLPNGGKDPDDSNRELIYWIDGVEQGPSKNTLLISSMQMSVGKANAWDFAQKKPGQSRQALVSVDKDGNLKFKRWTKWIPTPVENNPHILNDTAIEGPNHYSYGTVVHDIKLADGSNLVTRSQNWDDPFENHLTPSGAFRFKDWRPMFSSTNGQEFKHLPGLHDQRSHGRRGSVTALARRAMSGGFTWDLSKTQYPKSGYVVALKEGSSIRPAKNREEAAQQLREFLDGERKTDYVGGWFDKEHGEICLDWVQILDDRDEAVKLGVENDQQAIFDLNSFEEIDTGGTGGREEKVQRGADSRGLGLAERARQASLRGRDVGPDGGLSTKDYVRTPAGVRKYGQPIGSLIVPGKRVRIEGIPGFIDIDDPNLEEDFDARNAWCYQHAAQYAVANSTPDGDELTLVHGEVQISPRVPAINHSWVERSDGTVFEPNSGHRMTLEEFNEAFSPTIEAYYSPAEFRELLVEKQHWGPWHENPNPLTLVVERAKNILWRLGIKEDEAELEEKARHVRDADYWGMPVGTPIVPGMKPIKAPSVRRTAARDYVSAAKKPKVQDAFTFGAPRQNTHNSFTQTDVIHKKSGTELAIDHYPMGNNGKGFWVVEGVGSDPITGNSEEELLTKVNILLDDDVEWSPPDPPEVKLPYEPGEVEPERKWLENSYLETRLGIVYDIQQQEPDEDLVYWNEPHTEGNPQTRKEWARELFTEQMQGEFNELFDAPVVYVPDSAVLVDILMDGRFKSQHETGRSGGLNNPGIRNRVEYDLMNVPLDLPDNQRPIYGTAEPDDSVLGRASRYGNIVVNIDPDYAKKHATATIGDSLDFRTTPIKYGETDMHKLMAASHPDHYRPLIEQTVYEALDKDITGFGEYGTSDYGMSYPELQYHGGLPVWAITSIGFKNEDDLERNPLLKKLLGFTNIEVYTEERAY